MNLFLKASGKNECVIVSDIDASNNFIMWDGEQALSIVIGPELYLIKAMEKYWQCSLRFR